MCYGVTNLKIKPEFVAEADLGKQAEWSCKTRNLGGHVSCKKKYEFIIKAVFYLSFVDIFTSKKWQVL